MAKTDTANLQASLDTLTGHDAGTRSPLRIHQEVHDSATYSRWYVVGNSNRVATLPTMRGDRAMWVKTTVANSVANQAAEVVAAFSGDSNVDPDAQV